MSKITGDVTFSSERPPDGWVAGTNSWRVELRYQGRDMTVPFHTGPALGEPSIADVLECLVSDASSADETFENWCADLGFDPDSRKAEATYNAVVAQTKELRRLLGDDTIGRLLDGHEFKAAADGSVMV